MGGTGSGRYGGRAWRRVRVEECLILDTHALARAGVLRPGDLHAFAWEWPQWFASASLTADARDAAAMQLHVHGLTWAGYTLPGQVIALTAGALGFVGRRWGLVCACGRPCDKLYRPAGADRFGCRTCHRLAYASSQATHRPTPLEQHLARTCGLTVNAIRRQVNWRRCGVFRREMSGRSVSRSGTFSAT